MVAEEVPEEQVLTDDEDFEDGEYGDDYELDYGSDMADFDDD